jgi:hypothetical protein
VKSFQYRDLHDGDRVVVTVGKHKGVVGEIINYYRYGGSEITIECNVRFGPETPETLTMKYANAELADAQGNPLIAPVLDMTGREITEGTWLVYSVGGGKNPHGLEIGKVDKISPVGTLRVERIMRDGEKVANTWRNKEFRSVTDADRTLQLPCDTSTMTLWVLKDFEDLKDQPK